MDLSFTHARSMDATLLALQAIARFVRDSAPSRVAGNDVLAAELQAAAQGSALAFESFYAATARPALALVRRIAGEDLAEELVAECYFRAWRLAPRFDPSRGTAIAWLLALARKLALDRVRQDANQHGATIARARQHTTVRS
jgi:DNA-directed RNA polymerase specialized sigma24 family protein